MPYRLKEEQVDLILELLVKLKLEQVSLIPNDRRKDMTVLEETINEFNSAKIVMEDVPKTQRYLYLYCGRNSY